MTDLITSIKELLASFDIDFDFDFAPILKVLDALKGIFG